jgi:hypothetical protein
VAYEKTFLTAIVQLVEQLIHGRHDIQYNDIEHNDIQHEGLICETQHEQHSTQQHSHCGKKSFWALTQLQQEQSRVKNDLLYFRY